MSADESVVDIQQIVLDHLPKVDGEIPWKRPGKVRWSLDRKLFRMQTDHIQHEVAQTSKCSKASTVLFRSTYRNTTDKPMEYSIDQSRKTLSSVSCSISKGVQYGGSFELEVSPPVVGGMKLGLNSQVSFDKNTTETREEEVTWNFQTKVFVPSHKRVTAELSVTEEHREGRFTLRTYFSGRLLVDWQYKKKYGQVEITDLEDLLLGVGRKKFLGFEKDEKGKIYFDTKGVCVCHYGLEQDVIIREAELEEEDAS